MTGLAVGEVTVAVVAVLVGTTMVSIQPATDRAPSAVDPRLGVAHLYAEGGESSVHGIVNLPEPGVQSYSFSVADPETGAGREDVAQLVVTFVPPPDSDLPPATELAQPTHPAVDLDPERRVHPGGRDLGPRDRRPSRPAGRGPDDGSARRPPGGPRASAAPAHDRQPGAGRHGRSDRRLARRCGRLGGARGPPRPRRRLPGGRAMALAETGQRAARSARDPDRDGGGGGRGGRVAARPGRRRGHQPGTRRVGQRGEPAGGRSGGRRRPARRCTAPTA